MTEYLVYFSPYTDFLIRCFLAIILGGLIGIEREYKSKPAGVRTHVLICLGATALTHLSIQFSGTGDPSRIAAQIVSGIGFIGAGSIMQSRQVVQGLTTAASLWVTATIGMLIGAGLYMAAAIVTALLLPVLLLTRPFKIVKHEKKQYAMTIEIDNVNALSVVEEMLQAFELAIYKKNLVRANRLYLDLEFSATPLTQHLFYKRLLELEGLGTITRI